MRSGRALSVGLVTAAATIAACVSLSPQLGQTQQDSVVATPASIDFGAIQVGSSGLRGIQISPAAGVQDDLIKSITSCPQFPLMLPAQPTLPAPVFRHCLVGSGTGSGSTCSFDVQTYPFMVSFVPTVQGTVSCPIVVGLGSGSQTVLVQGTGIAADHVADVQPSKIDFGTIRRGTTSTPETITLRNAGAKDLTVGSVASSDQTIFTLKPAVGLHGVPVGTSESYTVTCTPPDTAVHTGTVTITSDDKASPAIVTLTCVGIDSSLGIDPSPANLSTRVGAAVDVTITISNSGSADSLLDSVALGSDSSPELTITSVSSMDLAPTTGSATVVLHYAAATPHPAGSLGTLIVMHDGDPTPRTASISAEARLVTIASQPAAVDFGPVCLGQKVDQLVAVYAATEGEFTISSFGDPAPPFTVAYTGTALPVANPDRANDVPFTVSVLASVPGDVASSVDVTTDAPGSAAVYHVPVKAHVLPAGVTATPAAADFGVVTVDTTSGGQMITLTNCSTGAIAVTAAHIDGNDADSFTLVSPTQPAMQLQTAQSEQLIVVLSPHSIGSKQAQLVVEYDGGTAMIELDGDVTGGSDTNPKPRETYYSCSAGAPAAGIPIVAALGLLLRRRRRK